MMHKKMLPEAEGYAKQNQLRRIWRKFVRFMACVVVFCTTYALILPAITLEKKCTLEEHVHTESCYTQVTTQSTRGLACSYESLNVHTHTQSCYDENGNQICGFADYLVHTHNAFCFDESGALVCQLPEIREHTHTEDCYRPVQTEPAPEETEATVEVHTHDESCYTIQLGALVCETAETEGHTHDESCYIQGELLCGKEETEGHTHGEGCSETVLICDSTEEDHTHDESCYQTNLVCDIPETEGHSHGAECYEAILNCDQDEVEAHRHTESCYEQILVLTCELDTQPEETEATEATDAAEVELELVCDKKVIKLHSHTDACYETYQDESGAEQKRLICTETVVLAHTHSDSCMETREEPVDTETLTCTLAEGHVHGEGCYDETGALTCTEIENHIHGALCYGTWVLVCDKEEHTHSDLCTDPNPRIYCWLTEHTHDESCLDETGSLICGMDAHVHVEQCSDYIGSLIVMIDTLPTSEEAEAALLRFEEAEDWDGYAAYKQKVCDLAWPLYYSCEDLSEEELEQVTNYHRLMDLSWLWSATTYAPPAKSPYYPMTNGEWLTALPDDNEFKDIVHINEPVPDKFTVDGLILGAKLTDRCQPSFEPVFTGSLAGLTEEECTQLTGYSWSDLDDSGLDNTYGANIILPAASDGHDALTEGKKNFVVYYNVGTYGGEQIDLLVQIVNYKVFTDAQGVAHDGILGFYSNGYIGIAVCGVEWVKLQYNFIKHSEINNAVTAANNGTSVADYRQDVRGSTSFYDIDYSQAVHIHGSENLQWPSIVKGIYVTNVPSPDPGEEPDHQPEEPDLDYVETLTRNADKRQYFLDWPKNDCVLKVGTVDHAYSNWTGPAIFSSHPYDNANEDWREDSKHGFTVTFSHSWFNINFSFNKGRNANGGIRHFGEPVSRGSLTIQKEIKGIDVGDDQTFDLQVTFYKQKNDGTYVTDSSLNGTYGGVSIVNGVGTFSLKDGGSITINNIPIRENGTHYRVTELSHDGYSVTTSMSSQAVGGQLTTDGPYKRDYYEGDIQADSAMTQREVVQFVNCQNAISVAKELTSTTGIEMLGNPDFSFQIMKADANGNPTSTPFFGAGVEYAIYDNATDTLVGTGTTGNYGTFILKAGQRAEFTGIAEDYGKYYVREILNKTFAGQYENIYVDGVAVTQSQDVFNPDDEITYKGVPSPVKDYSDDITVFTFNNRVDSTKLSYLTITKWVDGVNEAAAKELDFEMRVLLDGEPIPVGTPYTLYDTKTFVNSGGTQKVEIADRPHRVVVKEGVVTVPGFATAQIDNLLPGTVYHVSEESESAYGYSVAYSSVVGNMTVGTDGVTGVIPVFVDTGKDHMCMMVRNTLVSALVDFSAYKQIPNSDGSTASVAITANCISAKDNYGNGKDMTAYLGASLQSTKVIGVDTSDWTEAKFQFNYIYSSFPSGTTWPVKLIYEISEDQTDTTQLTHDGAKFYATFYLYPQNGKFIYSHLTLTDADGNDRTTSGIGFTNYLLGNMTLEKVVNGGALSQENDSFDFTIEFGTNSVTPLQNCDFQLYKNGVFVQKQSTGTNGIVSLPGIQHGDKIELRGLPVGVVWRITETNTDGYIVTWTKNGDSGSSNVAVGSITRGSMDVVYTNTSTYELPQTGSTGTQPYTMAGLVLIILSTAYLLYRSKARRRGDRYAP